MISSAFSASRSKASCSVPVEVSPKVGAACPNWEVEKENRANSVEIALLYHALHENRADHSAPADKANIFHSVFFLQRDVLCMRASILWRILHHTKSSQSRK
ncbi:Uncharacterised protein [Salmonella enterica subsp. enterica]|nr:Uncharacterised protein [Salmonella enterica subsp. enterica]